MSEYGYQVIYEPLTEGGFQVISAGAPRYRDVRAHD